MIARRATAPKPVTEAEFERVLHLMSDPNPAIADEGCRQCIEYFVAGRLPVDRLSSEERRALREIIDHATGRSVH